MYKGLSGHFIRGFTLVEVLTSVLIISIVSLGGYFAFFVLSGANVASLNRLHAIALSQDALEEVKAVSGYNFETLEFAVFPDIDQAKYPGFHRQIVITQEGTTELKRVSVTISWTERAQPRNYNLVEFLARPPEPLPANIHGKVTNKSTGRSVSDANVEVLYLTGSGLLSSGGQAAMTLTTSTDQLGNYDFRDDNGNPRLKPGDWRLKVSRQGYYDYVTEVKRLGVDIIAEDRVVNVELEPKPDPAVIEGRVIEVDTSNNFIRNIPGYTGIYVALYENGNLISGPQQISWTGNFSFVINFDDTRPRAFTIITTKGQWGEPTFTTGYCGNFPDTEGWGKRYNYRGWSSSVVREDGSLALGNPWIGSSVADRIKVSPGDYVEIDIPLISIPTAVLEGYVYDADNNPASGSVAIYWHTGSIWTYAYTSRSSSGANPGLYRTSVPAEQELFPDSGVYYLMAYAAGIAVIPTGSCGLPGQQQTNSPWDRIGPLSEGQVFTKNFYLAGVTAPQYGNAAGYVRDGKTTSGIGGALVNIWGNQATNGVGRYAFECSPQQTAKGYFMIPQWNYPVTASKSGYYYFTNTGNNIYAPRSNIYIQPNTTTAYEDIRLWPVGLGRLRGKVVIGGTTQPISGATVQLDWFSNWGIDQTTTTGNNGDFVFDNVIETWPAPGARGDSYYNQADSRHSINVSYTDTYLPASIANITLQSGEDKNMGVIGLRVKGQW